MGYGRYLIELLSNVVITKNVYNFTGEEPSNYLQYVCTGVDIKHLLAIYSIQPAVALAISECQQVNLSRRSTTIPFLKCWEAFLHLGLNPTEKYVDNCFIFISDQVRAEVLGRGSGTGGKQVKEVSSEYNEEKQAGNAHFDIFSGRPTGHTAIIFLRETINQFIKEAERSLQEATIIVSRAMNNSNVVAGGGSIGMKFSKFLKQHARTIVGKPQLFIHWRAKALEIISRQLCDNAGLDATVSLYTFGQTHALLSGESALYGVNINPGGLAVSSTSVVWAPSIIKLNLMYTATEAPYIVWSIDAPERMPKSATRFKDNAEPLTEQWIAWKLRNGAICFILEDKDVAKGGVLLQGFISLVQLSTS